MEYLQQIRPLTQEERESAKEAARAVLIGTPPDRKRFTTSTHSKYPLLVRATITAFCMVLLVVAFLPSAIRLHHIAIEAFMHAITDSASLTVAGWSAVFFAETGQLVFTLALAVLPARKRERIMLYSGALLSTAFALVGNVQLAEPMNQVGAFAWLEAIAPPVIVLITAHVLKGQMLDSIEARHIANRAFMEASDAWKARTQNPEADANWTKRYANALRDAIRKANHRAERGRNALMQLKQGDWYFLVQREIAADEWFVQGAQSDVQLQQERMMQLERLQIENANLQEAVARLQTAPASYNGHNTGEIAIVQNAEMHEAVCPHCGYAVEKASARAASNALAAHLRGCKARKGDAIVHVNGKVKA